jgi:response regulator RpfG family c-di-GMP phosphodiesterase
MADNPLQNTSVMTVDDTFAHNQTVQNVLKNVGFTNMVVVDNGETAQETFKKSNIDLVISEIKLPKVSGIQFFETILTLIKSNEKDYIKFLFFTQFGSEENIKSIVKTLEAYTADEKKRIRFDVILKPLRVEKLLQKLLTMFAENVEIRKHLDGQLAKLS